MTKAKYIINSDTILIHTPQRTRYYSRTANPTLYGVLKKVLGSEDFEIDLESLKLPSLLRTTVLKLAKGGTEVPGLTDRIKTLKDSGLPTEPYFNFLSRIPQDKFDKLSRIISLAGSLDAPLTWGGELVFYQRASWKPHDGQVINWSAGVECAPFTVIKGKQVVSDFNWCRRVCPDTGPAFEVVVRPEDIISDSGDRIEVSQLMILSKLGSSLSSEQQSEDVLVDYDQQVDELGKAYVIRKPYDEKNKQYLIQSFFTVASVLQN